MNFFRSGVPKGQVIGIWWSDLVVLNPEPTTQTASVNHEQIVANMRKCLTELKSEYMSEDGMSVNYEGISNSSKFQDYINITRHLHDMDLTKLSMNDRKSFFINVYNSLVIHAMVEGFVKRGDGFAQRLRMYATASYGIGGLYFSLNDIENGVLRGNRRSPTPLSSSPFSAGDPRLVFSVNMDPRVHFTLNCGARSCPPISVYRSDKLDSQLQCATLGALRQVVVSPHDRSVTVPMLLKWYREDFGSSDSEVLDWIAGNGPAEVTEVLSTLRSTSVLPLTVKYHPYDWDINS